MLLLSALLLGLVISRFRGHDHFWFVAWPGTIVHETLHYTVGKVLGANPVDFSVMPQEASNGERVLGSVGFTNLNWFNALPTAMAPLLAPAVSLFILHHFKVDMSYVGMATFVIAASILSGSYPSRADFEIALKRPMGLVFWAVVLYYALRTYG